MTKARRVALVGVDCGTPELLLERFADEMPTLTKLRERALWGPLRSIDPPISIPAWICMLSGRTPGDLGVYGMRNRSHHSYDGLSFATSKAVTAPRRWDLLSAARRRSVVLSLPGTYPRTPLQGCMVSCFLTPSTDVDFTWPHDLAPEVQAVTGGYTIEIPSHMATTRDWDFLFEHVFRDDYRAVDDHLAGFLEVLPDDTAVVVVSDHGGQPMVGGFCFNEWLQREGLLTLAEQPTEPVALGKAKVDWSRTTAWGEEVYPDDCNHSDRAVFLLAGEGLPTGRRDDLSIMDVAPTLQSLFGIGPQPGQRGMALA